MITFIRGGGGSFANFESFEGELGPNKTITFAQRSKKVDITNDSENIALLFKFKQSGTFGTLKPTETVSLPFQTMTVFLSGPGAKYRVWSYR